MWEEGNRQLSIFKALLNLDLVKSDEGANRFAHELANYFSASDCSLFVFEREKQAFRLLGSSALDKSHVKVFKIRETEFPWARDLRTGKVVRLQKNQLQPEHQIFAGIHLLFFPTMDYDELTGMIAFSFDEPSLLDTHLDDLLDLLRSVGKILKLSIENRLLSENVNKLLGLSRLTEVINSASDLDSLYLRSLKMTCDMLSVETGSIWQVNENGALEIRYWYGMEPEQILRREVPPDHGMVGWCYTNRMPFLSISVKKDPRAALDMIDMEIKSAIAVPLYHEADIFGVVILINRRSPELYRPYKHFDEVDLALLEEIAARISLVVSKMKYFEQLSGEYSKLRQLSQANQHLLELQKSQVSLLKNVTYINRSMRESYDIRNIYTMILLGATAPEGLGFDRALLLLRDSESQTLKTRFWAGLRSQEEYHSQKLGESPSLKYGNFSQYLREKSLTMDLDDFQVKKLQHRVFPYKSHAIFEKVVVRKKIVWVFPEMIEEWGNEYRELSNLLGTNEFVVVPLVGRLETRGVLILDNKFSGKELSPGSMDVLKIFSDNAGLAIENVQNYGELRAKTISLERQTSLLNYHKEFSQNVLESLDVAIVVLDRENKIREWNRKAETLFSRTKEQVLGMGFDMLGPAVFDLLNVSEKVYEVKNTIVLTDYEFKGLDRTTFLDIKFSPLRSVELSRIEGIIVVLDDITERKILEDEIRRQEKLASLGEMSARVAHEIRNPLSVIGGFASRLEKSIPENTGTKPRRYLQIIRAEVSRLEEIVEEILEFSRPSQRLEFDWFDLSEALHDLLALYQEKVEAKKLQLQLDIQKVPLFGDIRRIKQALINLIQNAIEAAHQHIGVRLHEEEGAAVFEIWNDGELISEETMEKIFSPFFTTKVTGTGLGLPITKKILEEEHGGKIKIESQHRDSQPRTSFTVVIPLDIPRQ
ncbi:MAG TPA: GAF domain-containing protein [Thermotogota bacterium]|nr:GAF domain-containing protein [Thermotogota bacterium]HRW91538.1 GAF domain-containing protein [Thermotogota bacterium]